MTTMMSQAELEKKPWFFKGSRVNAEKLLKEEEPGSFVIRPSSQQNCLALSHRIGSAGEIGHALIHVTPGKGYRLEQTSNSFPSLELLVLSIKKHFTVSDSKSLSTFGAGGGGGGGGKSSGQGSASRLSTTSQQKRDANMAELSEMFPGNPRESIVAALQLANGNSERAAELMLSEDVYQNQTTDTQVNVLVKMIVSSIDELQPQIDTLGAAVRELRTYQELKDKVQLGKAVADIKKALAAFPMPTGAAGQPPRRAKPDALPPGAAGTTQEHLVRFQNTVVQSLWEIQSKLDALKVAADSAAYRKEVAKVAAAIKAVREALEGVELLLKDGGGGGGGKTRVKSAQMSSARGSKPDEEFYVEYTALQFDKEIGQGAYGKVHKGRFQGREVAIKTIDVKDEKELALIRREIALLRECTHPNITELIGVSKHSGALLLVMEFVQRGELYKLLLDASIEMPWSLRLRIAHDTASGLAHVHSKGLIHRDIKSENLLVDQDWNTKLCDFGFARAVSHGLHRYTMCGSMYFNSPELLLGKPYDAKSDVFAFGILCLEIATRGSINLERSKQTAFGLDVKALEPHIPADAPSLFVKLAFVACSYTPARRPSMMQLKTMLKKIREKYMQGQ